ncbi:hypothetical protein IQ274_32415 [Nostoc sp. LEGE 12447]|uniref:hypothetical protein n=1 Tax=Nostoc sp. LEGE 12447 TaxID=1828640 RepID=UPI00188384DD|nr:hypothetical protein [Nostoc sp. LEGE 12447]MBE9002762.1 hypothetical protein [Nostoc sp. LEGE 12447]
MVSFSHSGRSLMNSFCHFPERRSLEVWVKKAEEAINISIIEEEFRSQNSGVRINQSGIQTRD